VVIVTPPPPRPSAPPDARIETSIGSARRHCPDPSRATYVLSFDSTANTLEAMSPGAPVAGQAVVVCIENADYADRFQVLSSDPRTEVIDIAAAIAETAEAPLNVEAITVAPMARGSAAFYCGGEDLQRALSWLESHRLTLLRDIRSAFQQPMSRAVLEQLRGRIASLSNPPDPRNRCTGHFEPGEPAREPGEPAREPGEPAREPGERVREPSHYEGAHCSLGQYVTNYLLPRWVSVVEGHILLGEERFHPFAPAANLEQIHDAQLCQQAMAAEAERSAEQVPVSTPPAIVQIVEALDQALRRTNQLVAFADQVLDRLERPQTVFDLGTFGGGRSVHLEVRHRRQTVTFDGSMAHLAYREHRVSSRLEIHEVEFFRIEPGFSFSLLRQPSFEVLRDVATGDSVIALRGDGYDIFAPAVFASFYWCGQDVRRSPWSRVCADVDAQWLRDLLPKLPSITIGIPINSSLVNGTANFFVGALFNVIPYVSLGVGVHLGLNVVQLRAPFRVGDPVPIGTAVAALTDRTVQAGLYFSLSIAPDAFAALSGFRAE